MGKAQTEVLVIGGLVLGMSVFLPLISKISDWLVPAGAALFAALVVWALAAMVRVLKAPPKRHPLSATVRLDWRPMGDTVWQEKLRDPWYQQKQ